MMDQVVLMIILGLKERPERRDLGYYRHRERMRLCQLRDIGFGDALLVGVGREDRAAVLRAFVGALIVELRRVHHREIDAQDLAERNLLRIEDDADRFRIAGRSRAHLFIAAFRIGAAGEAGHDLRHALHMLEHALHAPETAAGENRGLGREFRRRAVGDGRGQGLRRLVRARATENRYERGNQQHQTRFHGSLLHALARGTNFSEAEFMQ